MKFVRRLYDYTRCVPKTLFFNFYYLPLKQAISFPVIVSHRTKFQSVRGKVKVPKDAKIAKIKLGFGQVQVADNRYSRLIWDLSKTGRILLGNNVKVGTGCKLYVSGELVIGDSCNFTGECCITARKSIHFAERCLISWRTIIMDTDFHAIHNQDGIELNPDSAISIGKSVWICANSVILKGVNIGDNVIVSASSHVVSSFKEQSILGGNPAKIIGTMEGKTFQS